MQDLRDNENEDIKEINDQKKRSLSWIFYAISATVCFAISAYILGIISVNGASAKFLNSWGYLFVSILIVSTKNIKFVKQRRKYKRESPEATKNLSSFATLKDSCYYNKEQEAYEIMALVLSFICGLLNFAGEFSIIFAFQHALDSLLNQGILTSLFTLGAIIVLVGSVYLLDERVRFCECGGVILIILGTVFIALTKKGEEIPGVPLPPELSPQDNELDILIPNEGPAIAILLAILATVCFGTRGLILKYMFLQKGIDGISASSVFLITDGLIGGITGLVITLNGGAYAAFQPLYIVLGIVSGCLAGTGVLCLNISIMEGLAGPAVAMSNLSSVIQALLDWGFLGQVPSMNETLGLIIAVAGAIVMAVGDNYIIKPLFYRSSQHESSKVVNKDIENNSGNYKNSSLVDAMRRRNIKNNQKRNEIFQKEKEDGDDEASD
ncbi:unnamed protein product [Moneuplotes crassus]|uniref:EamA domain-containing protein n=1 Tax=Euplotes crassus TaxID=5936 RepID=A0AAD1UHF5_EUPCR|nr:unnamed protein product [Moneuplotes crassus]